MPTSKVKGKAAPKKAKIKGPLPNSYCIENCKQNGMECSDMLRCLSCNKWFHHGCVNENPEYLGSWNCVKCCQTAEVVQSLSQNALTIHGNIGHLLCAVDLIPDHFKKLNDKIDLLFTEINLLRTSNNQLIHQNDLQQQENRALRDQIAKLENKINATPLRTNTTVSGDLLLGTSLIRDINSVDSAKLEVKSCSGA